MGYSNTESKVNHIIKKWLTDNYGDLEIQQTNNFLNYSFYVGDDNCILKYNRKNGYCGFCYEEIWSFLESVVQLEFEEIQDVTKEWLKEHYKLGVTITTFHGVKTTI